MNKYTLRFNQNELEVKYQNTRLQIRKQILYGVSSGFISMNLASIILKVLSSVEKDLVMDLLILAFAIFSVILGTWNNNYIREGLTILNILQCSLQIDLSEEDTSQQMFLFGANIMATQIMLLFGSDFCYSVPQIGILFVSRIIILSMHQKIDWFSVALTQIVSFWLCVVQYQFDKLLRKQFLLTLKNHDWDSLLPQIIENPFFYFEFKDSQFQIKVSHKENQIIGYDQSYCHGCNLRKFLRNFLINTKTMEQFIIKKLNKLDELIQGKDLILKNKKGLEIIVNFSEIQDFTQNFIIIFKKVKNNIGENNFQRSIQNFLLQYSRQLVKLMDKKFSYCEILKLNYQYISILYYKPKSVSKFLPLKAIQKIKNISGVFEIQCTREPIEVFGFRNSFTIFWLQIALILIELKTYSNKDLKPLIIIRKQQDNIIFKLSLENEGRFVLEFKKNKILQLLKDKLFHHISYSQLVFMMYCNVNLSFRELDF